MDSKFGFRLKTLRKEKQLTQEEVAKLLNVHKGTISNWENGYRFPEEKTLLKMAEIFDCTLDYLLGRTDVKKPENKATHTKKDIEEMVNEIIQVLIDTGEITQEEVESGELSPEKRKRLLLKVEKAIKLSQELKKL
ncbi:helix-turn-helix domain-containing protein [Caloranaerobacter ferrireducens]|uniref:helix-turn-helix domain-containing protein n=1 Tax=Caloranaerobacter ferrireducens TaxID=1323370 RepID=UPI00084D13B6|nr:helix-turn-helix transcriptional regulator [Caloranaerobacter ferrireducens]